MSDVVCLFSVFFGQKTVNYFHASKHEKYVKSIEFFLLHTFWCFCAIKR